MATSPQSIPPSSSSQPPPPNDHHAHSAQATRTDRTTPATPTTPTISQTNKRRRTELALEVGCTSPSSLLRHQVREALAQETSPKARQNRLNKVYDTYRQRAIASQARRQALAQATQNDSMTDAKESNQCCASHPTASHASSHTHSHSHSHPASTAPAQPQPQRQSQAATEAPSDTDNAHNSTSATCPHGEEGTTTTPENPSNTEQQARSSRPRTAPPGVFPGKGSRNGCDHYVRKCWIKAACCGKYYACRRCHDENETHEIDRHATQEVACISCGEKDQPVSNKCRSCGEQFARYFCLECKFFDDREGHSAYHCEGCGICRVGRGVGIDNYHCNGCGICVPIADQHTHPCRERSLDANCPICTHYLATSTDQVVFLRCGHGMHVECLSQHTNTSYTCPICHKCVTDMTEWYRALDARLQHDRMPREYANRMSHILCHDCGEKSTVPFHFVYHKCTHCAGYNTRVLSQFCKDDGSEKTVDGASLPAPVAGAVTAVVQPQRGQGAVEEAST